MVLQVDNVSAMSASVSRNDWSTVLSEVLQNSCQPVCVAWLEQELCLKSSIPDKVPSCSLPVDSIPSYTL